MKFARRLLRHIDGLSLYGKWAEQQAGPLDQFCKNRDPDLWSQAQDVAGRMADTGRSIVEGAPVEMGGGGAISLIYFLCRQARPQVTVETGVAWGWSSWALLEALKANGEGHLFSSDLPYRKRPGSEKYIGHIVPQDLRDRWTLDTRGDRIALPAFAARCGPIGLLHYDSDKSWAGRDFALRTIGPLIDPGAPLIFDDIQDNFHFRDYVETVGAPFHVFAFEGKYVGLTRKT